MKLICLATPREPSWWQRLLMIMEQTKPGLDIELFTDCTSLNNWLCTPPRSYFAAVVIPHNIETIQELLEMKELLSDRKLALVIHGKCKDSLSLAYKLNPNYLFEKEEDSRVLLYVLCRWMDEELGKIER